MTYTPPICNVCRNIIPRGWDHYRGKPETPSHHMRRTSCPGDCHSKHMSALMIEKVKEAKLS